MIKKSLSIEVLLDQVENLRSKSRDRLSVEDVKVLDECIEVLKDLRKKQSTYESEEFFEKCGKVILYLLRFFTDNDLF